MFAVTDVSGINAAQIGVVLTFTSKSVEVVLFARWGTPLVVILAPMFGLTMRMTADVEVRLSSSCRNYDL